MKNRGKILIVCLMICFVATSFAQVKIKDGENTIFMENDYVKIEIVKNKDVLPPLRISKYFNLVEDPGEQMNLVNHRLLELNIDFAKEFGKGVNYGWPDNAELIAQTKNSVTVRSKQFIEKNGTETTPLQTTVTYKLDKNKVTVSYTFVANSNLIMRSGVKALSFFLVHNFDGGSGWSWTRKGADKALGTFNKKKDFDFSADLRPANHYRFVGKAGSLDIHSPDGAMEQTSLAKEETTWIFFNEILPGINNSSGSHLYYRVKKGDTFNKSMVFVTGSGSRELAEISEPSSMLSPFPDGSSNVVLQMIDDFPSLTYGSGTHWNVPDKKDKKLTEEFWEMVSLLDEFPNMKFNVNVIFDSMIGASQEQADNRLDDSTGLIEAEAGANPDEFWKFHSADKRVADTSSGYMAWLRKFGSGKEDYQKRIELSNGSYHYVRLDDVKLGEFQNDPKGLVPDITLDYINNVIAKMKSDAAEIGIKLPPVFNPPRTGFTELIVAPMKAAGAKAMNFGTAKRFPHVLPTGNGLIVALYENWTPYQSKDVKRFINLLKAGWPVITYGTYFEEDEDNLSDFRKIFKKAEKKAENLKYMFISEYADFVLAKNKLVWLGESYNEPKGEISVKFSGKAKAGQTIVINVPKGVDDVTVEPELDGKSVKDYFLRDGKIIVVLPKLKKGKHELTVSI